MIKELRTLVITEERHPTEADVWDAWAFAKEKHCYVELKWFIPHYGWKVWFVDPEKDSMEDILRNLNLL